MRVLVTGAAGFIGAALADALLARGDAVIGMDNMNAYYDPALKRDRIERVRAEGGQFTFHTVDFADMAALQGALEGDPFDAIVHLGAQAGVRYSIENPASYVQSNLVGHANILELARQRGVAHLVYASSSSVYGGNEKLPFSVDDRADHPVSLYAATKRADEMMSEAYAHLFRLPQTGLRFFTVYGPWGRPDMACWLFTAKILSGEPIQVFNQGEMWRDFTFIDDIVAGIVAALDHPPPDDGAIKAGGSSKPHALYNIGNHRSEKLTDFIAVLEDACGKEALIDLQPMQPGDVARTYADIDAIRADLGYAPTTTIAEGVPRFVDWYRGYHGV
ncbi:NAD-dependent epimerase/dehydratase family protein [Erythrobacter arachoides]|uniref:NAD-dependent epimerase/dehydratase family protein n=1 Tax=Aurantiacibacter arachoides TaxID=1850444 RepID=A0A845A754_9SPHN|nr:NAD-dependent epimerase/dehydratase family protein [Aurantiacibacter arachoides]MXO93369.1 NAD-dependent epimerase/dehydratase family protein [Aurantiacibacter arachoides]GGD49923.1 NAD-dependent epimerase [Aurantiacibacter arachoides]